MASFCENYIQWVLEDRFPRAAGIGSCWGDFRADVTPYEHMKLRILNGTCFNCLCRSLLDQHFVHEAMAHPLIYRYLEKMETRKSYHHSPCTEYGSTGLSSVDSRAVCQSKNWGYDCSTLRMVLIDNPSLCYPPLEIVCKQVPL